MYSDREARRDVDMILIGVSSALYDLMLYCEFFVDLVSINSLKVPPKPVSNHV